MSLKKVLPFMFTTSIAFVLGIAALALILRPTQLPIGSIDLNTVADGNYIGICQNKILFAVVEVKVQEHRIIDIRILEHKASYMKQANQVAVDVVSKQSLEVDAISGATLTRDTVLKAIEDAFTENVHEQNE